MPSLSPKPLVSASNGSLSALSQTRLEPPTSLVLETEEAKSGDRLNVTDLSMKSSGPLRNISVEGMVSRPEEENFESKLEPAHSSFKEMQKKEVLHIPHLTLETKLQWSCKGGMFVDQ